jgi:hypothetical protein
MLLSSEIERQPNPSFGGARVVRPSTSAPAARRWIWRPLFAAPFATIGQPTASSVCSSNGHGEPRRRVRPSIGCHSTSVVATVPRLLPPGGMRNSNRNVRPRADGPASSRHCCPAVRDQWSRVKTSSPRERERTRVAKKRAPTASRVSRRACLAAVRLASNPPASSRSRPRLALSLLSAESRSLHTFWPSNARRTLRRARG